MTQIIVKCNIIVGHYYIPQTQVTLTYFVYPIQAIWFTCSKRLSNYLVFQSFDYACTQGRPQSQEGEGGNAVLNKTCSVLLCVLEQPRVDNSSAGPLNWLIDGPEYSLLRLLQNALNSDKHVLLLSLGGYCCWWIIKFSWVSSIQLKMLRH